MSTLRFQPIEGRTEEIIDAILQVPEVASCTSTLYAIHLVCEELVMNVVSYAYSEAEKGWLNVDICKMDDMLAITFMDGGVAFNPLEQEQPDITLPLEERKIGGLGIFLTQQMMDEVTYQRENNQNILTIKKKISE